MIHKVLGMIGIMIVYLLMDILYHSIKHHKIKKEVSYDKIHVTITRSHFFQKLSSYLWELKNMKKVHTLIISPIVILFISLLCAVVIGYISYLIFSIVSTACMIGILSFFLPFLFIEKIYYYQKQKIIDEFPVYILSLKNYTQVSNNIITAMARVTAQEPLCIYIQKFNISVQKGIDAYEAFETLKKDIHIKNISHFITALQHCYLNGGNFTTLLEKYAKILTTTNLQREKEKQNNFSSVLILFVLILINIFILFSFVYADETYRHLITTTLIGKIIINVTVLSYCIVFFAMKKLTKIEE